MFYCLVPKPLATLSMRFTSFRGGHGEISELTDGFDVYGHNAP